MKMRKKVKIGGKKTENAEMVECSRSKHESNEKGCRKRRKWAKQIEIENFLRIALLGKRTAALKVDNI